MVRREYLSARIASVMEEIKAAGVPPEPSFIEESAGSEATIVQDEKALRNSGPYFDGNSHLSALGFQCAPGTDRIARTKSSE